MWLSFQCLIIRKIFWILVYKKKSDHLFFFLQKTNHKFFEKKSNNVGRIINGTFRATFHVETCFFSFVKLCCFCISCFRRKIVLLNSCSHTIRFNHTNTNKQNRHRMYTQIIIIVLHTCKNTIRTSEKFKLFYYFLHSKQIIQAFDIRAYIQYTVQFMFETQVHYVWTARHTQHSNCECRNKFKWYLFAVNILIGLYLYQVFS